MSFKPSLDHRQSVEVGDRARLGPANPEADRRHRRPGRSAGEEAEQRPALSWSRTARGAEGRPAGVHRRPRPSSARRAILLDRSKADRDGATARRSGCRSLRAGTLVNIQGIGARLSGAYFVTKTTHTLGESGYITEFDARREDLGGGRGLHMMHGPHAGHRHRQGGRRGRSAEPGPRASAVSLAGRDCCRALGLDGRRRIAGGDRGLFFMPEIGDEVVVGFEHGDFDHAYRAGRDVERRRRRRPPPIRASA